jgi:hypothetical protein
MKRALLARSLLALLAAGCGSAQEAEPEPPPIAPEAVSRQMHANFAALRDVYRALLVDDVAAARARAREFARMPTTGASREWDQAARYLRGQASRLVAARDAHQARALATETATYCADCHMFQARPSDFRAAPPPPDDGTLRGAMARHAWASDTLWLGVVAPSTDLWRQGLAEMASAPRLAGRGPRAAEVDVLGARLAALASGSSQVRGQNDRAARLAEVMDVCAACHAITRR